MTISGAFYGIFGAPELTVKPTQANSVSSIQSAMFVWGPRTFFPSPWRPLAYLLRESWSSGSNVLPQALNGYLQHKCAQY